VLGERREPTMMQLSRKRDSSSIQQLAEFLAQVSSFSDASAAIQTSVEWASELLEAEVAAVVRDGSVEGSVGLAPEHDAEAELLAAVTDEQPLELPRLGMLRAVSVPLEYERPARLVVARSGGDSFSSSELVLLRAMARVLTMTLRMLHGLENERTLRERSELERAEREQTESKYRRLVERLPAIVYIADVGEHGVWRYVSPQIQSILGFTPEEWLANPKLWAERLHPDDRERVLDEECEVLAGRRSMAPSDYRMIARDGRVIWFLDDAVVVRQRGKTPCWHGALYDITDRKRVEAELKLRAAQQAAVARLGEQALEGTPVPELMDRAVATVTETLGVEFGAVLELVPDEQALVVRAGVGLPDEAFGAPVASAGRQSQPGFTLERGSPVVVDDWTAEQRFEKTSILERLGARSGMTVIIEGKDRPFGVFGLQSREVRIFTTDDVHFVQSVANVLADAIERSGAEEEIRHQAVHDPLTRLPNRILFLDRLAHALAQSNRRRTMVAVLFLDIDHFKLINDSLGHPAGDELLTAVAPRLKDTLRPGDTVARFGGDEFGVLIEDIDDERDAITVAENISAAFTRPFILNGVEHFVTASIGIALAPDGNERPQALIRDADAAMYRAKERGRGRYELFDQVMRARALERLTLENELRRALGSEELRILYQPVVSLKTGAIVAVEALLRWQHPGRGLMAPEEFILVAEESGLIEPIGRWVLEESCRQTSAWQKANPDAPPVGVSVNLSARQLGQRDLLDIVSQCLRDSGLHPACLSLEITESALVEDSASTTEILELLRTMGVHVVIDDFGTGYSSLGYLKRFPLDSLKVDRSFVEGLGAQQESTAIVNAVVAMAGALSINVVAEGVETQAQLSELKRLGCDFAQGYYFAAPLPAAEIGALLGRSYPWLERIHSVSELRPASAGL
jgi:diguanylate cyclase (GGDEF)-like protein/PAS domain S-box-containing protein